MTTYNWPKIMEMKSNEELIEISEKSSNEIESEGITAAEIEIRKRIKGGFFTITNESEFPEKPIIDEQKQSYKKSLMSAVVFIAAFYFIFKWELDYIFILTGILLIHELGHLLAMKAYNYKDLNMFFIPLLGAAASGTKKEVSQKQKVWISMAGPLPGIIIGSFIYANGYASESEMYMRIGNIFIYLNLFNLLPIMPLDGGRILKDLFFHKKEKISIIFLWVSIACLIIIAIKMEAFMLLLIPVFLFTQINVQSEYSKMRKLFVKKGFDINKGYDDLSKKEYWLLRDELAINMKMIAKMIEPKRYVVTANEKNVINALNNILQKDPLKDIGIGGKIAFIFLWITAFLLPFIVLVVYYLMGLIAF